MKKIRLIQWLALLLAGALLLGFAACNGGGGDDPTTAPPTTTDPFAYTTEPPTTAAIAAPGFWSLEIRGVSNVTSFNSQDAQYLPKVQVEITSTNLETGLASKVTYGGITLRSLLSFCGVQYVSSVTVSSISGASAVYNSVMAMAEDTILAWEVDGAPIDADPPLRMCPKSGPPELLIRQVSSLHVIPGMPEPTTPPIPTYAAPPMGNMNDYNYTTTTRRTTWSTYPASVPGIEQFTTAPPQTNSDGTPVTTEAPTTATTTTTTTTTTNTRTSYSGYVQPTQRTTTTTTTKAKPDWWPPDVEWTG